MASTETIEQKRARLTAFLKNKGAVVVAFSGGVDSTFLAAVAHETLGNDAVAVTVLSPTYPEWEQREAAELARRIGIRHIELASHEMDDPRFTANPPDRCYYCKRELVAQVRAVADQCGIKVIADGTCRDDLLDHRPGRRAAQEGGVVSPLLEAGLNKNEIRELSRRMGLPTAEKPSLACLASRIPYGMPITPERLRAVDHVENAARRAGFTQVRARHHGDTVRLEVLPSEWEQLADACVRAALAAAAHAAGFVYVAADLEGYRTGSMNASLQRPESKVQ